MTRTPRRLIDALLTALAYLLAATALCGLVFAINILASHL